MIASFTRYDPQSHQIFYFSSRLARWKSRDCSLYHGRQLVSVCPLRCRRRLDPGLVTPLGPDILERLENGNSAENALAIVMAAEVRAELRQVSVVDEKGSSAAFIGTVTDSWSGHPCGPGYSVQGNMLVSEDTVVAMEKAFIAARWEPHDC